MLAVGMQGFPLPQTADSTVEAISRNSKKMLSCKFTVMQDKNETNFRDHTNLDSRSGGLDVVSGMIA